MERLSIQPIQWATLPELHDTPDLEESDFACLDEVRAVLARHGKLKRFAVHLAHRHFDMADDEILIERQDTDARAQNITIGRRADEPDARPTTWLFEEGPALNLAAAVYCVCVEDPVRQAGCVRHGKSRSPGEAHQQEEAKKGQRISEEKGRYEQGFPVGGHDEGRGGGRGR